MRLFRQARSLILQIISSKIWSNTTSNFYSERIFLGKYSFKLFWKLKKNLFLQVSGFPALLSDIRNKWHQIYLLFQVYKFDIIFLIRFKLTNSKLQGII